MRGLAPAIPVLVIGFQAAFRHIRSYRRVESVEIVVAVRPVAVHAVAGRVQVTVVEVAQPECIQRNPRPAAHVPTRRRCREGCRAEAAAARIGERVISVGALSPAGQRDHIARRARRHAGIIRRHCRSQRRSHRSIRAPLSIACAAGCTVGHNRDRAAVIRPTRVYASGQRRAGVRQGKRRRPKIGSIPARRRGQRVVRARAYRLGGQIDRCARGAGRSRRAAIAIVSLLIFSEWVRPKRCP